MNSGRNMNWGKIVFSSDSCSVLNSCGIYFHNFFMRQNYAD